MRFLYILALLLSSIELGSSADIPQVIRSLPSPLRFTIRHQVPGFRTPQTLSTSIFMFDAKDKTAIIDLFRVETFTPNATWTILSTTAGDKVQIYSQPPVPIDFGAAPDFAFKAEAKSSTPLDEVIAALVRAFSRSQTYGQAVVTNNFDREDRVASALSGITKSQLQVNAVSFDGIEEPRITQQSLLQLIRSTGATMVTVLQAEPWNVTNAFYQDPAVKKAEKILLKRVENGITDDVLTKVSATAVSLGNAPLVTAAGLRGFLKPVLDGNVNERTIDFKPSFTDHKPSQLFKDYTVTQKDEKTWIVALPRPAPKDATVEYTKQRQPGYYSFNVFIY